MLSSFAVNSFVNLFLIFVCINEYVLKDFSVAAEDGGRDKIPTAILFKIELPHIPFHQVLNFLFQ